MPLSDLGLRNAKPAVEGYRMAAGGGLYMFVSLSGGEAVALALREGKEQLKSLGPYPDVFLAEAREARDTARQSLRRGDNPAMFGRPTAGVAARLAP